MVQPPGVYSKASYSLFANLQICLPACDICVVGFFERHVVLQSDAPVLRIELDTRSVANAGTTLGLINRGLRGERH